MKSIRRLLIIAVAATAAGWAATAGAAPMLPKPYMFYSHASNMVAFRQTIGFHMYFIQWRSVTPNWGAMNIRYTTVLQGQKLPLNLPSPWKLAKANKSTGGWTSPNNPYKDTWPDVPEPTGIAALGSVGLLLARRRREA